MNNLNNKTIWQKKVDKLLFLFASVYLMITLGWLWKNKQSSIVNDVEANQTVAQQTVDENKLLETQPTDANPNQVNQSEPTELVLSIPLPEVTEVSSSNISNSITANTQKNLSSNLQNSSSTNLNNIPLPPLPPPPPNPTNPIQQQPQPISSPSAPKKIVSSPKKLAKIPTIDSLNDSTENKETSNVNNPPTLESSPQASNNIVNTNYIYSLVGVVQLPENNGFALFKINELTEKIPVGSEIGTSGWVLMAVNGNQAVISRNNQSVNIRVGETF